VAARATSGPAPPDPHTTDPRPGAANRLDTASGGRTTTPVGVREKHEARQPSMPTARPGLAHRARSRLDPLESDASTRLRCRRRSLGTDSELARRRTRPAARRGPYAPRRGDRPAADGARLGGRRRGDLLGVRRARLSGRARRPSRTPRGRGRGDQADITTLEGTVRKTDEKDRIVRRVLCQERFGFRPRSVGRILVVPATETSRRRVRRSSAILDAAFPARGADVRGWLRTPRGDLSGLLFLPATNRGGGTRARGGAQRVRTARASVCRARGA